MEELFELRSCIEQKRYAEAFVLIDEMEEMGRDDKINKIRSFITILLLHLIKKHSEKRTTRSWELSIRNSLREIEYVNKRRKSGGYYLNNKELSQIIDESYEAALDNASFEAFEGRYSESEIGSMIDKDEIKKQALQMIFKIQHRQ